MRSIRTDGTPTTQNKTNSRIGFIIGLDILAPVRSLWRIGRYD
jgi:hypothetical protein